ncbi:MAG: hypothetical protein LBD04_04180 [Synergistaceae bacterium]|nr:hypothetical protein [Synergistaceae bacterium]
MSKPIEQQRFMCAIGAMQTVVAIPRAVPILHSGPGCGPMVSGFFDKAKGYAGENTAPCTNFTEREVVFGGEDKLEELIRNTYKVLDTDLQVVLTGCTSAIVGDDVERVVKTFAEEGKPIVTLETPGFKCSNFEAHDLVVNAVIDQYVDRRARVTGKDARLVNLFATIPYQDPFWKGNLEELKRVLKGIGLRVNTLFGPYSRGVEEWKTIPAAGFNIVISPWYGLKIARRLEEKYDQPYYNFPYLPIGGNETTRFLRGVERFAAAQGAELPEARVNAFIAREELAFYEALDGLATFLLEFRYGLPEFVHVLHDANYVIGIAKFLLHETGIVPKEQFVTDNTPEEYHDRIRAEMKKISNKKDIPVFFEPDGGLAQRRIRDAGHEGRGLILGCGWDKRLARDKGYDFLSISPPSPYRLALTTCYAGYKGGLRLIEDIYDTVLATYE